MAPRHCIGCGAEIHACMGFVYARDIVFHTRNDIGPRIIRELCAKCGLRASLPYADNGGFDPFQQHAETSQHTH